MKKKRGGGGSQGRKEEERKEEKKTVDQLPERIQQYIKKITYEKTTKVLEDPSFSQQLSRKIIYWYHPLFILPKVLASSIPGVCGNE
jgi:transcriptional regulator CtsR